MIHYPFVHASPDFDILKAQMIKRGIPSPEYMIWNYPEELLIYFTEELSEGNLAILTNLIATEHPPRSLEKRFLKNTFDQGLIIKEQWYETDNGNGAYSGLAEETEYLYDSNALISSTTTIYWDGEIIKSIETFEYYSGFDNTGKTVIMKKKVDTP